MEGPSVFWRRGNFVLLGWRVAAGPIHQRPPHADVVIPLTSTGRLQSIWSTAFPGRHPSGKAPGKRWESPWGRAGTAGSSGSGVRWAIMSLLQISAGELELWTHGCPTSPQNDFVEVRKRLSLILSRLVFFLPFLCIKLEQVDFMSTA